MGFQMFATEDFIIIKNHKKTKLKEGRSALRERLYDEDLQLRGSKPSIQMARREADCRWNSESIVLVTQHCHISHWSNCLALRV